LSAIYGLIGCGDEGTLRRMGNRLGHRGDRRIEWRGGDDTLLGAILHPGASPPLQNDNGISMLWDADLFGFEGPEQAAVGECRSEPAACEAEISKTFLQSGPDSFSWFNGYFAVAAYDSASRTLVLARDPLGVRPLFYWNDGARIAFASEYKALLCLDDVPATPDLDAVQFLQSRKLMPTGRTQLRDVLSVVPGSWMQFRKGERMEQRYFRVQLNLQQRDVDEHARGLRERFIASVRERACESRRVGIMLSGGVDSTCVAAAFRQAFPDREFHSFTAGSSVDDGDMRTARRVAELLGTEHHEVIVGPESIEELLPFVVWHLEDPIARSETLQYYVTAQHAKPHVDVLLGGQIADGLYGGMPKHKILSLLGPLPFFRRPFSEFYGYTQTGVPAQSLSGRLLEKLYFRNSIPPVPRVVGSDGIPAPGPFPPGRDELLNRVLRDGVQETAPQWLPKVDRMNAAHGIRVFSPFVDLEMIRHAFEIPDRFKIRRMKEKYILRRALLPLLDKDLVNRPKYPQRMAYDTAFSYHLEFVARRVLSPQAVRARGFFEPAAIERLLERPRNGKYSPEHAMRIWTAVSTELWARLFIDGRGERP
jgi:asparagine synthase (glutamine-hydrolysing)